MMDLKEIKRLIQMVEEAQITHFSVENNGVKVEIKKEFSSPVVAHVMAPVAVAAPVAPVVVPEKKDDKSVAIKAQMVGTFYASPNPDAENYVKVGDKVKKGQVVCIIEAMKLFNEIESDYSGTIVEICVENGSPVEYGKELFRVRVE